MLKQTSFVDEIKEQGKQEGINKERKRLYKICYLRVFLSIK